jgi:hypothetical protein
MTRFLLCFASLFLGIQIPKVQEHIIMWCIKKYTKLPPVHIECDIGFAPFFLNLKTIHVDDMVNMRDIEVNYRFLTNIDVNIKYFETLIPHPHESLRSTMPIRGHGRGSFKNLSNFELTIDSNVGQLNINENTTNAQLKIPKLHDMLPALTVTCSMATFSPELGVKLISIQGEGWVLKKPAYLYLNQVCDPIDIISPYGQIFINELVIPFDYVDKGIIKNNKPWQGRAAIHIDKGIPLHVICQLKGIQNVPFFDMTTDINIAKLFKGVAHFKGSFDDAILLIKGTSPYGHIDGTTRVHLTNQSFKNLILSAQGNLKNIDTDDILEGKYLIKLTGFGRFLNPMIEGFIEVKQGLYTNLDNGTTLQNINLKAILKNKKILIQQCTGYDAPQKVKKQPKMFQAKGSINLLNIQNPTIDLNISFQDFQIADSPFFFARFDGNLNILGTIQHPLIKGHAQLKKGRIVLDEVTAFDTSKIKIINKPIKKNKKTKAHLQIPIDIKLDIPSKLYIRGMGFNSEWKGKLWVKGNLPDPYLEGQLSSKRGFFNFVGKRLKLQKSYIFYSMNYPNQPKLSIVMVKSSLDSPDVFLKMLGQTPKIEFSITTFPEKSVLDGLSLLIFSKESKDISLLQAAQLTSVFKVFKSKKDINLLTQVQTILENAPIHLKNYERFDAKKGEVKYTNAIGISKEFKNAQVSIDQSTEQHSSTQLSVQVPLSKNLNIDATMGTEHSGIGLNYQKRY